MTDIREAVARALGEGALREHDIILHCQCEDCTEIWSRLADAALAVARPLIEAEALREAAKAAKTVDPSTFEHDGGIIADTVNDCVRAILSLLPTPTQEPPPMTDGISSELTDHNNIADLIADRDQWKARAEAAEHLLALGQRQIDEKAADRIATLEAALRIANTGGLDLLYAIREAIGWTDKHALSLLPDECRRLKAAASRKSHGWPGEDYDHSQPGGFDGPTGAD